MISRAYLASLFLLGLITVATAADLSQWEAYRDTLLKDPSLVRFYSFQEMKGQYLVDQVARGAASVYGPNTMTIMSNSAYGRPRTKYVVNARTPYDYARWTEGRWPGKGALATGVAKDNVVRSQFYGTASGDFTLLCWVRPHLLERQNYGGGLVFCGGGYKEGWRLSWSAGQRKPEGQLNWAIGTPEGTTSLYGTLSPGIWHGVALVWSKGHAALYVDGKLAQEKQLEQTQIVWPERPDHALLSMPIWDIGGLKLGRAHSKEGDARADMDELAIFDRAISAGEAATLFQAGNPELAPAGQVEHFRQLEAQQAVLDQIELSIPADTFGYFQRDQAIIAKAGIPAALGLYGDYALRLTMVNLKGEVVLNETLPMSVEVEHLNTLTAPIHQKTCGLYWLTMDLLDEKGAVLKSREYPLAIMVPLPPNGKVPLSSPLACHHMEYTPEHAVLGNKSDRMIRGWRSMERKQGEFNFDIEDRVIASAESYGMNMLFCLDLRPPDWVGFAPGSLNLPADMGALENFLRVVVSRYKGRVAYYEIFNEPNSGHGLKGKDRAKDYVTYLKLAYRVIKEVDPQAQVAAFSGVHRFVWFQEVMAQNPGKSYDIVTLHNYGAPPIPLNRERRLVQNVRQLLDDNGRQDAKLWNGESGIGQPAREGGRPISDERLMEVYAGRLKESYGYPIAPAWVPMTTERRAACWQAQAILLDLADGCDKFFLLAGPSSYAPYYNSDDGSPAEKGIAKAAVSSVLIPSKTVERLPLVSTDDAAILITGHDGSRTLAAFSLQEGGLTLAVGRDGTFTGMDYLGNPLTWTARQHLLQLSLTEAPVYIFDLPADVAEVPLITLDMEQSALSADYQLHGTLTLRNPWDAPREVTLAALPPENIEVQLETAQTLTAGETRKIPFSVTGVPLWHGWYRLGFTARQNGQALAQADTTFYSSGTVEKVTRLDAPLTLTANPADWPAKATVKRARTTRNVVKGKPLDGVPGDVQWLGPDDLSFTVRTAWHPDTGLYFLLDVTDNALKVASEGQHWFQYDCLELFVDTRPVEQKTLAYSAGAQQIVVKPQIGDEAATCELNYSGNGEKTVTLEAVGKRTATGYVIEGLIRPRPGYEAAFGPGKRLHLDFYVDDTDTDKPAEIRKAVMALHSVHEKSSVDSSQWGGYELQ